MYFGRSYFKNIFHDSDMNKTVCDMVTFIVSLTSHLDIAKKCDIVPSKMQYHEALNRLSIFCIK